MAHAGLSRDWLVSSSIDLELKQYVLLGYLQRVHARFKENKLYPHLEELASHLKDLSDLLRVRRSLVEAFPGNVVGFDLRTGQLHREPPPEDEVLSTVNAVIVQTRLSADGVIDSARYGWGVLSSSKAARGS